MVLDAVNACMQAFSSINYEGIKQVVVELSTRINYLAILKKTDWPLYLVMDEQMAKYIGSLSIDTDAETLRSQVCDIALDTLDSEWINEVHARWDEHDELPEDKRILLGQALNFHKHGQYEGCVTILMCLIDGLLCQYCNRPDRLSDDQQNEFNSQAKKHHLTPIASDRYEKRPLKSPKDLVLVLLVRTENGHYLWEAAVAYIVDIVLTNRSDFEKMAAHNPLRNKICHGLQTNYGTKEYSLKAILATDIVIRLGSAGEIILEDEV